jgi:quinol-cytochrome oxidoreductase complex cytochrome b subunit
MATEPDSSEARTPASTPSCLGLRARGNFLYNIHPPHLPATALRLSYTWGLGGITLWLGVILCVTGILEAFYYVPAPANANGTVKFIAWVASYGWLVRGIHFWAAQAMVVTAGLHLARVFLTGAAKDSRRFNWLLGIALLMLTLFLDFTGFTLRWDQESLWAMVVGTSLLKEIPLVGDTIYIWVVGDPMVTASTLVRFYGWHVVALPAVAVALVIWHLWRIRRDGGISHMRAATGGASPMASRDALIIRELLAAGLVIVALLAIASYSQVPIGPAADMTAPLGSVRAPWIFLGIQVMLRYLPPFLAGIAIPAALLLALATLPYLEPGRNGIGEWLAVSRRPWLFAFAAVMGIILSLLLWGTVGS